MIQTLGPFGWGLLQPGAAPPILDPALSPAWLAVLSGGGNPPAQGLSAAWLAVLSGAGAAPATLRPARHFRAARLYATPLTPDTDESGTPHLIYEDAIARLLATGRFDAVLGYESTGEASADWPAMARVIPGSEEDIDDVDPDCFVLKGQYTVIIYVRDEDPVARDGRLAQLANAARNALGNVSLANLTMPQLTQIRRRGTPAIEHPQTTCTMDGEWAMLVMGGPGFYDESDPEG